MAHCGNGGSTRRDRFSALDAARRVLQGEDVTPAIERSHGVGFADLVEALSRAPEAGGVARSPAVARGGPEPMGVAVTDPWLAHAATTGTITLHPEGAARRVIRAPRRRASSDATVPSDADLPLDEAVYVLATAPDHYDRSDVDGSETLVILDPLRRWAGHPIYLRSEDRHDGVRRAWEVFSEEGKPHGLMLWKGDRFAGVDMCGETRLEPTLAGAAWQMSVNF